MTILQRLFSVLAFVFAAFMLMSAAFVLVFAASFTFMSATFVSGAALLTGLSLAAVLSALVHTSLTVVSSASGVSASALVMALVFADFGLDGGVDDLFRSVVVVACGHAESESGSDKSSQENFLHFILIVFCGAKYPWLINNSLYIYSYCIPHDTTAGCCSVSSSAGCPSWWRAPGGHG